MASGRLGATDLTANSEAVVYTVPASKLASLTINAVNKSGADAKVRLALASGSTAANSEFIEYNTTIPSGGVLERTGIMLDAGKHVTANLTSGSGVNVVVYGYEV